MSVTQHLRTLSPRKSRASKFKIFQLGVRSARVVESRLDAAQLGRLSFKCRKRRRPDSNQLAATCSAAAAGQCFERLPSEESQRRLAPIVGLRRRAALVQALANNLIEPI